MDKKLLDAGTYELDVLPTPVTVPYAVLFHTWEDDEATFQVDADRVGPHYSRSARRANPLQRLPKVCCHAQGPLIADNGICSLLYAPDVGNGVELGPE